MHTHSTEQEIRSAVNKLSKKYLTVTKRKAERDSDNGTNERLPKARTRKYDEAYAAPVVTVTLWVKVFYVFEKD